MPDKCRILTAMLALFLLCIPLSGCSAGVDIGQGVSATAEEIEDSQGDGITIPDGGVPLAPGPGSSAADQTALEILEICNEIRTQNGLPPFEWSNELFAVAQVRAAEIVDHFSHTRPDGKDWLTAYKEAGLSYSLAAENVAIGHSTARQVVDDWMTSKGHKANILGPNTHMAAALVKCPASSPYHRGYAFAQLFVTPKE